MSQHNSSFGGAEAATSKRDEHTVHRRQYALAVGLDMPSPRKNLLNRSMSFC